MKNQNSSKHKMRTSLLWVALFAFFIFGCSSAPVEKAQMPSADEIANGNVENGLKLFMGNIHLENGGPPCMGCHSVADNGILGGGALGPNLTNITAEKSEAEILGLLSNTGSFISPVMLPIYTDHPLTTQEQSDLLAFMKSSAGQPETDKEWLVIVISILGTIGVAIAFGIIYRDRLRNVRRAMVRKAEKELL